MATARTLALYTRYLEQTPVSMEASAFEITQPLPPYEQSAQKTAPVSATQQPLPTSYKSKRRINVSGNLLHGRSTR